MSQLNSFGRLREAINDVLRDMGAMHPPSFKALQLLPTDDGEPITIPLFPGPKLTPSEQVILDAINRAGEPQSQRELARKSSLALRVIQDLTPKMIRKGVLLRHPSLGFYPPGMDVSDVES